MYYSTQSITKLSRFSKCNKQAAGYLHYLFSCTVSSSSNIKQRSSPCHSALKCKGQMPKVKWKFVSSALAEQMSGVGVCEQPPSASTGKHALLIVQCSVPLNSQGQYVFCNCPIFLRTWSSHKPIFNGSSRFCLLPHWRALWWETGADTCDMAQCNETGRQPVTRLTHESALSWSAMELYAKSSLATTLRWPSKV